MQDSPHLLLVDDEPAVGDVARHLTRRAGHELTHCRDAPTALDHLQRAASLPDLVLLDVKLPGMSGLELHRELLREDRFQQLRFALLSQLTLPESIAQGLDQGIDFLVAKDLLSEPEAWSLRMDEVLSCPNSPDASVLTMPKSGVSSRSPSLDELHVSVSTALRRPPIRALGPDVQEAVLRRSLHRVLEIIGDWHKISSIRNVTWQEFSTAIQERSIPVDVLSNAVIECLCCQVRALLGKDGEPILTKLREHRL